MYITTKLELENFCQSLNKESFIAIDTEFSRESTYYPKLCLIQMATKNQAVIIDALNLDLSPLAEVLQNENIVKVFHSAKQDLEILNLVYNCLPKNIFDTQIAASFCGFNSSISYEALVLELLEEQIDKSHRVSDWTQRPLTSQQTQYALADVTHLYKIYSLLLDKLKQNKRLNWALEEMNSLNNPSSFIVNLEQIWQKIKDTKGIKISLILKKLAAWREIKAQQENLPRNHYLNERYLIKLAEIMPINTNELRSMAYFKNIKESLAEEIITVIQNALEQEMEQDLIEQETYLKSIDKVKLSQLKELLNLTAEQYNLTPSLIASTAELKALCYNEKNLELRFLKGWRYDIFGKLALEI